MARARQQWRVMAVLLVAWLPGCSRPRPAPPTASLPVESLALPAPPAGWQPEARPVPPLAADWRQVRGGRWTGGRLTLTVSRVPPASEVAVPVARLPELTGELMPRDWARYGYEQTGVERGKLGGRAATVIDSRLTSGGATLVRRQVVGYAGDRQYCLETQAPEPLFEAAAQALQAVAAGVRWRVGEAQ